MEEPEDIKKDYHDTVKGIKVYAKCSKRFKNRPKASSKNGHCRSLSDEEIAKVERKLIDSGENINPKYSRKEVLNMNPKLARQARLDRLADSMADIINETGYFVSSKIKNSQFLRTYISPDNSAYFDRTYLDDIRELGKRGLFYSKGSNPKTWYKKLSPPGLPPLVKKGEAVHHIVIDINLTIDAKLPKGAKVE